MNASAIFEQCFKNYKNGIDIGVSTFFQAQVCHNLHEIREKPLEQTFIASWRNPTVINNWCLHEVKLITFN